jgi:hypothetical protein
MWEMNAGCHGGADKNSLSKYSMDFYIKPDPTCHLKLTIQLSAFVIALQKVPPANNLRHVMSAANFRVT